tara:strand:- start:5677 stop:6597 length:921 start_codon:yes stop_codon:yes gene_type:complete
MALGEVFPHFRTPGFSQVLHDLVITEDIDGSPDIVFSCLPQIASSTKLKPFLKAHIPSVDVSADFRLKDQETYKLWYGSDHPAPEHLNDSVYGLPELHRSEIATSKIVGNPGCYPTASLLAITPALKAGLILPEIIVDAKSGISGAGRTLHIDSHYSEVNENVHPYKLEGHRHSAEMVQELSISSKSEAKVTFVPHLIPMTRGILASCYAPLAKPTSNAEVNAIYRDAYKNENFIFVTDTAPRTKWTAGTNYCAVHARVSPSGEHLMMFSALDNLVKGAAGQAVQNANIMLGIEETSGLKTQPTYP